MLNFDNINLVAVFVASLASFGFGVPWYTVLFGKLWQKEVGLTDEQVSKPDYAKTYGGSFVCMLLMSFAIAVILNTINVTDWMEGAKTGMFVGLFLSATSIGINYLYQLKSLKLFLIDASYQVIFTSIMGAIITLWK